MAADATPDSAPFKFVFRLASAVSSATPTVELRTSLDNFGTSTAMHSPNSDSLFTTCLELPTSKEVRVRFFVDGKRTLSESLGRVREKGGREWENVVFLDPSSASPLSNPGSPHAQPSAPRTRYDRYDDFVILDSISVPVLHFDSEEDEGEETGYESDGSWEELDAGAAVVVSETYTAGKPIPFPTKTTTSLPATAHYGSSGRTAYSRSLAGRPGEGTGNQGDDEDGIEPLSLSPPAIPNKKRGKGYLDDGMMFDEASEG